MYECCCWTAVKCNRKFYLFAYPVTPFFHYSSLLLLKPVRALNGQERNGTALHQITSVHFVDLMKGSIPALIKKAGPVGGLSGDVKDMDINGITCIVEISVRHYVNIDALAVTFLRNGLGESTGQWGGGAGKLTEFDLKPFEYITSVKGHIGRYEKWVVVKSLTFETNLRCFGPYGYEEGDPFELPAIGGQIIGFHGRAGGVLDAIGIYIQVPSQVLIQQVGPVGGHGGVLFNMDTNGISRIVKISVRVGGVIDGFGVSFIRDGREESAGLWGASHANLVEFHIHPSEYITSIKGEMGMLGTTNWTAIYSLKFETNLGSFEPYGTKKGIPFELPALGGEIIGFHGNAKEVLYSFGVYVKAIKLNSLRDRFQCYVNPIGEVGQYYDGQLKWQSEHCDINLILGLPDFWGIYVFRP